LARCCDRREKRARLKETFSILVHWASIGFSSRLPALGPGLLDLSNSKTNGPKPGWTRFGGRGGTSSALGRLRKDVPQLGQDWADSGKISAVHFGQVTAGSGTFEDSGRISVETYAPQRGLHATNPLTSRKLGHNRAQIKLSAMVILSSVALQDRP